MMFDLISWGIGYTLSKSGDWVKNSIIFRKDLLEALSDTAEKWNEELPKKYRIDNPETLFRPPDLEKTLFFCEKQINIEQSIRYKRKRNLSEA